MKFFEQARRDQSEFTVYMIFGCLTTIINYLVYLFCRFTLGPENIILNTSLAWLTSVLFAYFTNKIWVFKTTNYRFYYIARELSIFISSRFITGLLDIAIMKICVDWAGFNDLIIKVISSILVIIINYLFSKIIIFRGR